MGNTRDQVGKAGLFVAGGIFRTAFYVCVAVLIFWIGKSAYQFGYNVFNQQAVSPGAGQEVTVVIPEGSSTYDVAKILKSKGLIDDSLVFFAQEKLSTYKGQMQAGTYLLSTAYRLRLVDLIRRKSFFLMWFRLLRMQSHGSLLHRCLTFSFMQNLQRKYSHREYVHL